LKRKANYPRSEVERDNEYIIIPQVRNDVGLTPQNGRVFWTRPFILTTYRRQPSQKDLAELEVLIYCHVE